MSDRAHPIGAASLRLIVCAPPMRVTRRKTKRD
jgi:hypothetical protein